MKIFDMSKIFGTPIQNSSMNKLQMRIIILKRFKQKSCGEKIIGIQSVDNPFKIYKTKTNTKDFTTFFETCNAIQKEKERTNKLVIFKYDSKIKFLGNVSNNITEISSLDLRFLILWNFNPNIKINLFYKEKSFFDGDFGEFQQMFPNFDITSKKSFIRLLSFVPTKEFEGIKGIGTKRFIKYLIGDENFDIANPQVEKLVEGIA